MLTLFLAASINIEEAHLYKVNMSSGISDYYVFTERYATIDSTLEINSSSLLTNFYVCEGESSASCKVVDQGTIRTHFYLYDITANLTVDKKYSIYFTTSDKSSTLSFRFEEFLEAYDHIELTMPYETGAMQFKYMNCLGEKSNQINLQVDDRSIMYYTSEDKYVTKEDCTNSSTTRCGVTKGTITSTFAVRVSVYSTMLGNKEFTVEVYQSSFIDIPMDGLVHRDSISISQFCSGYYKMDISDISDGKQLKEYITALSVVASHSEPYNYGNVVLLISIDDIFEKIQGQTTNGVVELGLEELENLVKNGIDTLYFKVDQYLEVHNYDFETKSEVMVSAAVNLHAGVVGTPYSARLAPYKQKGDNISLAAAQRMYVFNFQNNHPMVQTTDLTTSQVIDSSYVYAFKFTTSMKNNSLADSNLYIDFDSFASKENNVGATYDYTENGNFGSAAFMNASMQESSKTNLALGETVFYTGIINEVSGEQNLTMVDVVMECEVVMVCKPRTQVSILAENNYRERYFQIPRSEESKDKGGNVLNVVVSHCTGGSEFYIYTSRTNPMPNSKQYEFAYGPFENETDVDLPFNKGDDYVNDFVGVYTTGTCKIDGTTYLMGDELVQSPEGESNVVKMSNQQTVEYAINLDGDNYYKQDGYIKINFPISSSFYEYDIYYAFTRREAFKAANNMTDDEVIMMGSVSYQVNPYTVTFKTKGMNRYFLTLTRVDHAGKENKTEIAFSMQAGSVVQLSTELSPILPMPVNGYPLILEYQSTSKDDIRLSLESATGFKAYECGNSIPGLEDFSSKSCVLLSKDSEYYYPILSDDTDKMSAGISYIAIVPSSVAVDTIKVAFYPNRRLISGLTQSVKSLGEEDFYFTIPIKRELIKADSFVAELEECDNCAICFSLNYPRPNFDPYNIDHSVCQMVVGKREADDELYGPDDDARKMFNKTDEYLNAMGAQYVHGVVKSLDAVGTVEKVKIKLSSLRVGEINTEYVDAIGYTEEDVSVFDGITYYYNQQYQFVMPKSVLQSKKRLSFTVGPELQYGEKLEDYINHSYSVYASAKNRIPTAEKFEWLSDNDMGLAVLAFSTTDITTILNSCDNVTDKCNIYIAIESVKTKGEIYSNTTSWLSIDDTDKISNVIEPLNFHSPTTMTERPIGARSLYHFNVIANPMSFILSPCHGMPYMRAGYTDFFYRSIGGSNKTVESSENVYVPSGVTFGLEYEFMVKNNTRWASETDYEFEIGDFDTTSSSTFWGAEVYAGSYDPRPEPGVRTIEVGYKSKKFQVRFKPSTPSGMNSAQSNIEYNIYMLGNYNSKQMNYYVPTTSCGYTQGGLALKKTWMTSYSFSDTYTLISDVDYSTFTKNAGTQEFYITVIARQKDNKAMIAYNNIVVDMNKLPGSLSDINKTMTGGTIALIVIVVIVLVIAIVFLTVCLIKKRKAPAFN